MPKLKVVALISGGKDSFFSILHCINNGHDVIALANLHPPRDDGQPQLAEDIDSFMYQTIGHHVIPLYEEALGLPLYRQEIQGGAVNTDKSYARITAGQDGEKEDETESLLPLLRRVMQQHPEVNAVCSGAILSDYQRTRVESVAIRLGLTSLAYLWQYPRIVRHNPAALLDDMAAVGQDARIIKVASGGLDESFLWSNVADPRTIGRLLKASKRFGDLDNGAALGEGGEYETLAVAGPALLWRGRIVVGEDDIKLIPGEAGSASVRISNAHVSSLQPSQQTQAALPKPEWLGQPFSTLLADMQRQAVDVNLTSTSTISQATDTSRTLAPQIAGDYVIANITGHGNDAAQQTTAIMESIKTRLAEASHDIHDVAYTSIILRDMNDFAAVNAAYAKSFQRPNPPARMTLACADILPEGKHVSISVTSRHLNNAATRQGLHVQSLSYWAPANIGPYSQAIAIPIEEESTASTVYIAGQIPLLPATMELVSGPSSQDFLLQALLSLQHLHRIRQAMSVRHWIHAVVFITASSHDEAVERAALVRCIWSRMHVTEETPADEPEQEDDETFDVWHHRFGHERTNLGDTMSTSSAHGGDFWIGPAPALQVFRVDTLPRQASIEWVAFGSTSTTPLPIVLPHYKHILELFARQAL